MQSDVSRKKLRLKDDGRKPCLSTIKDALMEKIAREREQQHHVSCKSISIWAKEMGDQRVLSEFAASRGWLSNFIKRFNLSITSPTTTGLSVPGNLRETFCDFVDLNKKQINIHKLNMDEMPIWADMSNTSTIQSRFYLFVHYIADNMILFE